MIDIKKIACVLVMINFCFVSALLAAPGVDNWIPFVLPWDDSSTGSVDVSFLLHPPAGSSGFVKVKDGHFYSGDKRIRFLGTNVCFSGCFPELEDGAKVAARMARFGINCVRFHHMDSNPFPRGIFKDRKCEELSPEALKRLDRFIYELKQKGIYIDLNLHVSRSWSKRHGWKNANKLEKYDKMIDIFYPELIEAQAKYARDLLTHKNPYTHLRYIDEPAIAIVEITNEDSLFMWSGPRVLPTLPQPYAGFLKGLWNNWLCEKYGNNKNLKKAWAKDSEPLGAELIHDPGFKTVGAKGRKHPAWLLEQHDGASMQAEVKNRTVMLVIHKVTGVDWNLQFKQPGIELKKGAFYTVRFKARSDKAKKISIGASQAHSPWKNLGLSKTVNLVKDWKEFVFGFTCSSDEKSARISFSVGSDRTGLEFSGISLRPGGRVGLGEGESLSKERDNVELYPRLFSVTEARLLDRLNFYHDIEERYFTGMYKYLKKELGLKALVTGTIAFGSLGTHVQSQLDFVDQHAYWHHPNFPHRPWDPRDWIVRNDAMSSDPGGGTLAHLASTRVAGKPYTVTEYNHPAPLDSQAETVPMIASFAALQDWDAVFLFTYNHSNSFKRTMYHGFFDIDENPAKLGFVPACALLFSDNLLPPLQQEMIKKFSFKEALEAASESVRSIEPHLESEGFSWRTFLEKRWAISFGEKPAVLTRKDPKPSLTSVSWNPKGTGRYIVSHPAVKVLCGKLAGDSLKLGDIEVTITAPGSATFVIVSRDGLPFKSSRDMLLTACGRCENTNMVWNKKRDSVSDKWGEPPVLIEVVRAALKIRSESKDLRVFSLDERGQPKAEIAGKRSEGLFSFSIGEESPSLWYSIKGS